jgi:hypothetical protein
MPFLPSLTIDVPRPTTGEDIQYITTTEEYHHTDVPGQFSNHCRPVDDNQSSPDDGM